MTSETCGLPCVEGCFCPSGKVYDAGTKTCVEAQKCSCEYGGQHYAAGKTISRDCESCTCANGKWECSEKEDCTDVCYANAFGNFWTFDDREYNFYGACQYTMVENCPSNDPTSPAAGNKVKISTSRSLTGCTKDNFCYRKVTVKVMDWTIESIDDNTVKISHPTFKAGVGDMALPYMSDSFDVLRYSSMIIRMNIKITGYSGMSVVWDNEQLVQIIAPTALKNNLCGLCGTFNDRSSDDYTPSYSKVYENDHNIFASSWQEDEDTCNDEDNPQTQSYRCPHLPAKMRQICCDRSHRLCCNSECNHLKNGR
jgi:hypothetical protein